MRPQEPDLDRVIDEVAREMMAADAPASLRATVLARLEGRAPAGGTRWRWVWVPAAALGAAIVIAAWLDRPVPQVSPLGSEPLQTVVASPSGTVAPEGSAAVIAGLSAYNERTAAASRQAARLVATRPPVEFPDAAPPLGAVAPIVFEQIDPDELSVWGIGVEPLPEPSVIDVPSLDPGSPEKHQPGTPERD